MGWGMLIGAGQGLQGAASSYGRIMDDKRKNDFQLKRDEIQFDRQKSLQDLANSNQNARDQKKRGWDLEDDKLNRSRALEDRSYDEKREQKLHDRNKEDELEVYEKKKSLDVEAGIRQAEELHKFRTNASQEELEAKVQELQAAFMEDGELDFKEKMTLISAKTGFDLSGFYQPNGKPMTAEMFDKVSNLMMNNEKYIKMAEKDPMGFAKEAKRIGEFLQSKDGQAGRQGGEGIEGLVKELKAMPDERQMKEIMKIREEQGPEAANMLLRAIGRPGSPEATKDEPKVPETRKEQKAAFMSKTWFAEREEGWLEATKDNRVQSEYKNETGEDPQSSESAWSKFVSWVKDNPAIDKSPRGPSTSQLQRSLR